MGTDIEHILTCIAINRRKRRERRERRLAKLKAEARMRCLKGLFSHESDEWYTPEPWIGRARLALGGRIELDPASCAFANRVVKAERIYTLADDGLSQPHWKAETSFLNGPYGGAAKFWLRRIIAEYACGNIGEAVVLLRASYGTAWFRPAWQYDTCVPNCRIPFYGPDGKTGTRNFGGSIFVYLGKDRHRFLAVFAPYGVIRQGDKFVDHRITAEDVQPCRRRRSLNR